MFDEVEHLYSQGLYPELCQSTYGLDLSPFFRLIVANASLLRTNRKKRKKAEGRPRAKGIYKTALPKAGRGHGPATWTNNMVGLSGPQNPHI